MMKKLLFTMLLALMMPAIVAAQDDLPITPMPTIEYEIGEGYVTIYANGEGEVHLFIDNMEVENPYMYPRSYDDMFIVAMAYAQGEGMQQSEVNMVDIYVPAMEMPIAPMPQIEYVIDEDFVTIYAYGDGDVHLFIDDMEVENPYMYPRSYDDEFIVAMAYAQAEGMQQSEVNVVNIYVPAMEMPIAPMPSIEYEIAEDVVTIYAYGEGEVHLFINDMEVGNPYMYPRAYDDEYIVAMAYAQVEGMQQSEIAAMEILIPALPPIPEQTSNPDIVITSDAYGRISVGIYHEDPDAIIYYSFASDDQGFEFSEWYQYSGEILFEVGGNYIIRAFAVTVGMIESEIVTASFTVIPRFSYTVQPMAYANQVDEQQGLKVYFKGDPYYYYYLIPGMTSGEYRWPTYVSYKINNGNWEWCRVGEPIYLPNYGDYTIQFYGEAEECQNSVTVTAKVHYDAENYYSTCNQYTVYNGVVYYTEFDGTAGVAAQFHPLSTPYFYLEYEGDIVIPEALSIEGSNYPVTAIHDEAFAWYSSITSLTIPKTVTHIGNNILSNTNTCLSIKIDDENPVYDTRDNCNAIIETASNTLMQGCLSSTIPNTVTTIGYEAFYDIPITSIDIPNSVISIGDYAFAECRSLSRVSCHAMVPPSVGDNAFYYYYGSDLDEPVTLFVPAESLEDYRAHETWGMFPRIVPFIGAGPGDVNGDGAVNITDVTGLIDQLLSGEELPAYIDVNGDGVVNITDVTGLIDQLLNGGN